MEAGKAVFFPQGKNVALGTVTSYCFDGVGNYNQIIDNIDLKSLIDESGGPSKTRIYIYATKKVNEET